MSKPDAATFYVFTVSIVTIGLTLAAIAALAE
jgi:hypothetical protein